MYPAPPVTIMFFERLTADPRYSLLIVCCELAQIVEGGDEQTLGAKLRAPGDEWSLQSDAKYRV